MSVSVLEKFLPDNTLPFLKDWFGNYNCHLKITRNRNSKLGDYRKMPDNSHQITINGTLEPQLFFFVLTHELAHLIAFEKYGRRISPHGQEWKESFRVLMTPFLSTDNLPLDVLYALRKYLQNPAAASCSDATLMRTLKLYDTHETNGHLVLLEHLPYRTHFLYNGSRIFEKGEKLRKRYRCKEISSGTVYLFSPLAEVEVFEKA